MTLLQGMRYMKPVQANGVNGQNLYDYKYFTLHVYKKHI